MKNKLCGFLLPALLILTLVSSCRDVNYDYSDILPTEFRQQILSFKEYGQIETSLEIANEAEYTVTVYKGGIRTSNPTQVQIRLLSQEELDERYNEVQATKYMVLPDTYWTMENSMLTIAADKAGASTNIVFNSKKLSQKTSKVQYVLPLRLECATDSVNVQKMDLVLIPKLVPAEISFEKTTSEINLASDAVTQTVSVNLKKAAKLSIPCELMALSQKYVSDEYSITQDYKVVPETMYKISRPRLTLAMDDNLTPVEIQLNSREIISEMQKSENVDKVFVLALRLVTSSSFASVSSTAGETIIIFTKE